MKAFSILVLLTLLTAFNILSAQSRRGDSAVYLQKIADSLTGDRTLSKDVDTLYHIIGSHYLQVGQDSTAARYLLRVRYDSQRKFNELGTAYSRIRRREDSAFMFFKKAAEMNVVNNGKKNVEFAITSKNLGDQFLSRRNTDSALAYYQQAIVNLVDDFDEDDLRLNPYEFDRKQFSSGLFEVMLLKAKALVRRYNEDGKVNDLMSAVNVYSSLYRLAPDSSRSIGMQPVDVAVKLFELTGDDVFLRHAFSFAAKITDTRKLQSDLPGDNAVLSYQLVDTSVISLFLSKNKLMHARTAVDSTFEPGKSSKKDLYSKLVLPFERELAAKNKLLILRDEEFSAVKFENILGDSHVISYMPDHTFQKEKTYSFVIWIMIAVVIVLAFIVIKKIR